jgi:hypothetical protein
VTPPNTTEEPTSTIALNQSGPAQIGNNLAGIALGGIIVLTLIGLLFILVITKRKEV